MIEDQSYGIIPLFLEKNSKGYQFFLVKHQNGQFWGFPKGHLEKGESGVEAAIRELKEETDLVVDKLLSEDPLTEYYCYQSPKGDTISKRVDYYLAEVKDQKYRLQSAEIVDGEWFVQKDVIDRLTYPEGKALGQQVIEKLRQ